MPWCCAGGSRGAGAIESKEFREGEKIWRKAALALSTQTRLQLNHGYIHGLGPCPGLKHPSSFLPHDHVSWQDPLPGIACEHHTCPALTSCLPAPQTRAAPPGKHPCQHGVWCFKTAAGCLLQLFLLQALLCVRRCVCACVCRCVCVCVHVGRSPLAAQPESKV